MIFIFQLNTGKRHNGCAINYGRCSHYVPGKKLPTWKGKRTFGKAKQPKPKLKQRNDAIFQSDSKPSDKFARCGEKNGNSKMTDAQRQEAVKLRQSGMSNSKIGQLFGMSDSGIRSMLKTMKTILRSK